MAAYLGVVIDRMEVSGGFPPPLTVFVASSS